MRLVFHLLCLSTFLAACGNEVKLRNDADAKGLPTDDSKKDNDDGDRDVDDDDNTVVVGATTTRACLKDGVCIDRGDTSEGSWAIGECDGAPQERCEAGYQVKCIDPEKAVHYKYTDSADEVQAFISACQGELQGAFQYPKAALPGVRGWDGVSACFSSADAVCRDQADNDFAVELSSKLDCKLPNSDSVHEKCPSNGVMAACEVREGAVLTVDYFYAHTQGQDENPRDFWDRCLTYPAGDGRTVVVNTEGWVTLPLTAAISACTSTSKCVDRQSEDDDTSCNTASEVASSACPPDPTVVCVEEDGTTFHYFHDDDLLDEDEAEERCENIDATVAYRKE